MHLAEILQPVDREELAKALEPFLMYLGSGDQPLKPKHIAKKLEQTLKQFGVDEVKVITSKEVDSGDMNMNAAYDPHDDEDGFDPFSIDLVFSVKDKNLEFTKDGIANIRDRVLDALEHEMIHMRQYRSRSFVRQRDYKTKDKEPDVKRAKEYLGNDDEIEAFAKNISAELLRKRDKQTAIDLLRKVTQTAGLKDELGYLLSPNLLGYLAVWGFNTKHPVIKKLLKKVYNNIENS
tara:strand:- start:1316 stop:2020 length:705 start_codon:yes stop_codon:yes gene_type:complete